MSDTRQGRRNFLKTAAVAAGAAGAATVPVVAPASDLTHFVEGGDMPRRPLGRTGVDVPIMHLGTSQRLDPDYDKVLHRCFANGVRWFDTALSYGSGASHRAVTITPRAPTERNCPKSGRRSRSVFSVSTSTRKSSRFRPT